jgi:hypothetical protein
LTHITTHITTSTTRDAAADNLAQQLCVSARLAAVQQAHALGRHARRVRHGALQVEHARAPQRLRAQRQVEGRVAHGAQRHVNDCAAIIIVTITITITININIILLAPGVLLRAAALPAFFCRRRRRRLFMLLAIASRAGGGAWLRPSAAQLARHFGKDVLYIYM